MIVNFIVFFNVLLFWFPADQGSKKVVFCTFFKLVKISYDSEKTRYQNTSLMISFKTTMYPPFIFVKKIMDLLALWC